MDRRTLIKGAAWAAPLTILVTATPARAASGDECGTYHGSGNNGTYHVSPTSIIVQYKTAPDIYEANVRFADGSTRGYGTNYGTAPARGSLTWIIALPMPAKWVQIHGFNDHYGENC